MVCAVSHGCHRQGSKGPNNATKVWVETSTAPVTIPNHTVTVLSRDDMYDRACKNAGPRPLERYSHNARSIKKLTTKQGQWVNHESEVGGFTKYIKRDRKLDGTATFDDGERSPDVFVTVSSDISESGLAPPPTTRTRSTTSLG